ncbi:MAG: alpha/beta hydrolase [bacterium]|nr:alpha/beta hydrolase [bacterium]
MRIFDQFKSKEAQEAYIEYLNEYEKRWKINSEDFYITTEYGNTFVRKSGQGKSLVLLPGTNGSSIMYNNIVEKLSEYFTVYVIDIVGDFGRSFLNVQMKTTDDYIKWQYELYSKLNLEDGFSIIGISMGAWLGALYGTTYKNLSSLVMISPVSVVQNISLRASLYGIIPMFFKSTNRYFMSKYFKDYLAQSNDNRKKFNDEILDPIKNVKQYLKPLPPVVPKQFDLKQIKKIECKTLYMVGENELLYKYKNGLDYFSKNFKNGSYEVFANAGHDLFPMRYNLICDKVIKYLK